MVRLALLIGCLLVATAASSDHVVTIDLDWADIVCEQVSDSDDSVAPDGDDASPASGLMTSALPAPVACPQTSLEASRAARPDGHLIRAPPFSDN